MISRLGIFIESFSRGKGGAEKIAASIANEFVKKFEAVFIICQADGELSYSLDPGVTVVTYELNIGWELKLKNKIQLLNLDLLHIFYFNRRLINFFKVIPENVCVTVQECTTPKRLIDNWLRLMPVKDRILAKLERESLLGCVHGVRFTREDFVTSIPEFIRKKSVAFYNGYEYHSYRAEVDKPVNNKYKIIFISGMKANKNIKIFLQAFNKIKLDFPSWDVDVYGHIPATISGKKGFVDEVCGLIESLGLTERINIHGITDNIYEAFSKSHLHVITSLEENFSLSTLEAMSCGLPSVGIKSCVGVAKLITNNDDGLLSGATVDELEFTLRRAMENHGFRKGLAERCLANIAPYNPIVTFDNWNSFFCDSFLRWNNSQSFDRERELSSFRIVRRILDNDLV